jgi:hypothetical protein
MFWMFLWFCLSLDYYISVNIEDILKMKKSNRKLCPCSFHDLLHKNSFKTSFHGQTVMQLPQRFWNISVYRAERPPPPASGAVVKYALVQMPGVYPGPFKAQLWVLVNKKARAFVKMTKTWQFRQPALPPAFPSEKHEIARAFYVKYDQNYGLWCPAGNA